MNNKMCAGLLATMAGGYLLRRQGLRWGATDEEVHMSLPGDGIVPHPMLETTHAVTVQASAEEIWPWLVQMGHYRAGFYADPSWWDKYADRYLKSLSRKEAEESGYGFREVPSLDRLAPEFQNLKEGDTILDGPPGTAFFTVRLMEENRALVLYSDTHLRLMVPKFIRENPRYGIYGEFGWAFVLEQKGDRHSRLIVRTRANYGPRLYRTITLPLVLVGGEFFTTRKMLYGIKRRVERTDQARHPDPSPGPGRGGSHMSPEFVEKTHFHPERREPASRDGRYITEKLRSAAVTFGPSVVLDLFQATSVLVTALGRLPDPHRGRAARILRPILTTGALAPWAYLLLVRPWHRRWGATDEEVRKRLPGDDLVPHPMLESTRAVTIRAAARQVWPWLVQLGQDRGGFYSYDWLENLAAADIHNADRIVPEMQHLKVGDFVPMAPLEWGIPTGGFTVAAIEPRRAIVWLQGRPQDLRVSGTDEGGETWVFVLEELAEGTTRLILRERKGIKPRKRDVLYYYMFVERQHFVMVRRMLIGIKERAERAQRARTAARGRRQA